MLVQITRELWIDQAMVMWTSIQKQVRTVKDAYCFIPSPSFFGKLLRKQIQIPNPARKVEYDYEVIIMVVGSDKPLVLPHLSELAVQAVISNLTGGKN